MSSISVISRYDDPRLRRNAPEARCRWPCPTRTRDPGRLGPPDGCATADSHLQGTLNRRSEARAPHPPPDLLINLQMTIRCASLANTTFTLRFLLLTRYSHALRSCADHSCVRSRVPCRESLIKEGQEAKIKDSEESDLDFDIFFFVRIASGWHRLSDR